LKDSPPGEFYVPSKFLTDHLVAVFLTGIFYTNPNTRSNFKNAKAALFHDITFANMEHPDTFPQKWPELTKTLMAIRNDVKFKSYKAAKAPILGDADDIKIKTALTDPTSEIP
jgi:hypothetical protein